MVKVASFNANSLRSRLPVVTDWLAKNEPDILCLQETKVQDKDFPSDSFANSGYDFVFKGEKSYNGVAIFSRHKIKNVEFGLDDEPKDEARLIKATIGKITIVNTYVPQGYLPESDKFQYKLQWFGRLLKFFKKRFKPEDLLLWTGDFNIAPDAIDVYDPVALLGHVCYHPDIQKSLKEVMDWGFIDVFRKYHKDKAGEYSFWDYRMPNAFKRNLGWRLDHIMATKPLAAKSTDCHIDKEPRTADKPSDHTFVVAEFNL